MLFFGIGFAIGILLGIYAKRQGIRERDEEIERLRNLVDDLEYYLSKGKEGES